MHRAGRSITKLFEKLGFPSDNTRFPWFSPDGSPTGTSPLLAYAPYLPLGWFRCRYDVGSMDAADGPGPVEQHPKSRPRPGDVDNRAGALNLLRTTFDTQRR